ncbi:DNA polymerase III subunit alpha, partial [Streptomyces sp. NPDC004658]
ASRPSSGTPTSPELWCTQLRTRWCTQRSTWTLVDLAFFEDSHEACAHTIFHHGLLLVRGTVEARGPRRTVVGEMAWDLDQLAAARATHGPQAVLDILGRAAPAATPAQPARTIQDGTAGARLHPYADLQPAGSRSADLSRLGHKSQGSAG